MNESAFFEHGNEASGSIKDEVVFLDRLSDYYLMSRDSVPCSWFYFANMTNSAFKIQEKFILNFEFLILL
jgi:hypothetical protein